MKHIKRKWILTTTNIKEILLVKHFIILQGAVRKQKLTSSPFCEECYKNGTIIKATMVDHIVPIKQGGAPLDMDNLQSLCWSCHSRKSIEEGSRFGKKNNN